MCRSGMAPSATVPNPAHTHVVHEDSIASVMTSTDAKCSSQLRLGDTNSDAYRDKKHSSWYQQMRSSTCVQQAQADCRHQRLPVNQESPTIYNRDTNSNVYRDKNHSTWYQ
ncbi:hypothetical protein Tco_0991154 [Tanacetum coccineum]|uniref:Uncharacterized protein n=1 Tax=Tanacetum coccineum TaxID=301880 RepID=A0ABQ5EZN1_9ASTR